MQDIYSKAPEKMKSEHALFPIIFPMTRTSRKRNHLLTVIKVIVVLALLNLYFVLQSKAQVKNTQQDLWPRGVNYQIFVRSFCDSNNDGIGDIKGIISKLDYLKDLGINGLWLTPFNPSPSYHKYDVVNYMNVDPEYGTIDDVKLLTSEARKRGMHVLMDLVVNHSSVTNSWFLESKKGADNKYRNYYEWSDVQKTKGQKNWWPLDEDRNDTTKTARYYGFFGSNMPDMNYDNPEVRKEIKQIGQFWVKEVGIDGFRLDAAQHIYDEDEHDKSRQWWQEFRVEMEKSNKNFFMLGEVWNVDSIVAPYLKKGLHSVFNFDLAIAIIKSLQNEKNDSIIAKHLRIMDLYKEMDANYVDATFLTNHDQNRIASELSSNTAKTKLAAAILLTLPGTPHIYYGEELGMKGVKPDEAIREPFLWDVAAKDSKRTKWIAPKHNSDEQTVPYALQSIDANSIFNYYKQLIHLRNGNALLQSGALEPISNKDLGILAYSRKLNGKTIIVVHNLTGHSIAYDTSASELKNKKVVFSSDKKTLLNEKTMQLSPYSSVIFQ